MTETPPRTSNDPTVRTLVVWCPSWPVVAAGAEPGTAAAVVHADRVVATTPLAEYEGVMVGMRRREAQARCPGLVVLPHDPARDARAFAPIGASLDGLTPRLELAEPGRCAFPTLGPSRYFGGDDGLARRAGELVRAALGERVEVAALPGVGAADGLFSALLAARRSAQIGDVVVIPRGASGSFLASWPVSTLGEPELADLLVRLGLPTLGAFAALESRDVLARFGKSGAFAHRLARGLDPRAPATRPPPPDFAVVHELDPPAERVETAAFVARAAADELQQRLSTMGLACTRVAIEFETEHGETLSRLWRAEGALGAAIIAERVRWQLDGWLHSAQRPTGGISVVRLVPDEVVAARGRQLGFWGGQTDAADRATRAVARVSARLGPEAALVPSWRGGRQPLDTYRMEPAAAIELGEARAIAPPTAGTGGDRPPPWPGAIPPPYPSVVLSERVEVDVLDASGTRVGVTARGLATAIPDTLVLRGGHEITAWAGPWLSDERWWDPATRRRRARFQVVIDDGAAYLLSLEGGSWWVEAMYD